MLEPIIPAAPTIVSFSSVNAFILYYFLIIVFVKRTHILLIMFAVSPIFFFSVTKVKHTFLICQSLNSIPYKLKL